MADINFDLDAAMEMADSEARAAVAPQAEQSVVGQEGETFEKVLNDEKIKNLRSDRGMREGFATKLYYYMVGWSLFVVLVTFLQGCAAGGFHLETTVMSILLGTTTVSVLGLILTIIQGLFPKRSE